MLRSTTPQQQRAVSQPYYSEENSFNNSVGGNGSLRRKGSFSFLRRSKSRDRSNSTGSAPQRKLSKKERSKVRQMEMTHEQIPSRPPKIPLIEHQPDIQTFGGEEENLDNTAIMSSRSGGSFKHRLAQKTSQEMNGTDMYRGMPVPPVPPIPPIPGAVSINRNIYSGTYPPPESMAHRGRSSYASSAISTINSPRKLRRRKDPTPFNILVVGARNAGKTSFLNLLRASLSLPAWKQRQHSRVDDGFGFPIPTINAAFPSFTPQYVETELDAERIGVTLWDSEGLEPNMVDIQIQDMTTFIENKFEDTFNEESKIARTPGFLDTHIHCVFLVLDPIRLDANLAASQKASEVNGVKAKANSFAKNRPEPTPECLDENLDLNVLRALKDKTTVVPVIAKADTITLAHMKHLKRAAWQSLKKNGLESLDALGQDDEDGSDTASENGEVNGVDERDEDAANDKLEEDKFSMTSVLGSPSDTSSTFSASDFDLAKPGKPWKASPAPTPPVSSKPQTEPPGLPLSIISPDPYDPEVMGRRFPWGFADPMNSAHCDFVKLKDTVFREWRGDLREASRELWYEGWRTNRLNKKARRDRRDFIVSPDTQVWAR